MTEPVRAALVGAERRTEPDELESGINQLIERRSREEDPNGLEERWEESERQYHDERREALRHMWITYYRQLSRSLSARADHFEGKAASLAEGARHED